MKSKDLLINNRVNFIVSADYSKNTEIEQIVKTGMKKYKQYKN